MNMREKMARAICARNEYQKSWDECSDIVKGDYFADADVVLAELYEPTEPMVNAALGRYDSGDGNNGPTLYHDIFRAMIRAAGE